LLAIRAYPLPVRATAAALARRRDLVPVLGLRSVGRHAGAAYLPLLVLTLTVAIGVFSSVVSTTVERGQDLTAWQAIGGDFRVDAAPGRSLDEGIDAEALSEITGVQAAADARSQFVAPAPSAPFQRTPTLLHAIDVEAYQQLVAGTPVDVAIPPVMAAPAPPPSAEPGVAPIPALVSRRAPTGWPPRASGDTFELDLDGRPVTIIVAGFVDSFPGISRDTTFAVIPLSHLTSALGGGSLRPNVVYLRAEPSAAAGLADVAGADSAAALASRYESVAAFRDAPLVAAVGIGFFLAVGVAVGYAALAIMAVVALDAARRARELAYLRTMGLSERQMVGLTVVEHAPPVIVALATGTLVGLALAWVLEPGLDLAAFIDAASPVAIEVDRPAIVGVAAIVVAVVAVAVMASSLVARHLDPARALRMDA
jgi:putative ABC transport system permease protein